MEKYTVIGDPISHSISPAIHNAVFNCLGRDFFYDATHVKSENICGFIKEFKAMEGEGFNITVPHKAAIIPFLDHVSKEAQLVGAVNTVKNIDGRLYGHNTDIKGFTMMLEDEGVCIQNTRIKIIGAGGTTRAIVCGLIGCGAEEIKIYNRTASSAYEIAERFPRVQGYPLQEFSASDCDILINTTSVGLYPNVDHSPIANIDDASPDTSVVDVIYSPPVTRFLKMAADRGLKYVNGLKMLVFQALLADEIWLDIPLAQDKMVQEKIYGQLERMM